MRKHNYTESTEAYLEDVEAYLIKRYGQINPEWAGVIELLGDTLDLYKECQESIKENGIFDKATYHKNPLISTMKDCQATMMKLYQHLGVTPYATAKINDKEADDSDLLSNIMGI